MPPVFEAYGNGSRESDIQCDTPICVNKQILETMASWIKEILEFPIAFPETFVVVSLQNGHQNRANVYADIRDRQRQQMNLRRRDFRLEHVAQNDDGQNVEEQRKG